MIDITKLARAHVAALQSLAMRRMNAELSRPAILYNGCSKPINTRERYLLRKKMTPR